MMIARDGERGDPIGIPIVCLRMFFPSVKENIFKIKLCKYKSLCICNCERATGTLKRDTVTTNFLNMNTAVSYRPSFASFAWSISKRIESKIWSCGS